MKKRKENALHDFIIMIGSAWTVNKMTESEKNRLLNVFHNTQTEQALIGSYEQRWKTLQAIFTSYLQGIGYTDFNWRETEEHPF